MYMYTYILYTYVVPVLAMIIDYGNYGVSIYYICICRYVYIYHIPMYMLM